MHRLVLRQLRRNFGDPESVPEEWKAFIQEVSDAYTNADGDRHLAERSLELTSQELIQRLEDQKRAEEARDYALRQGIAAKIAEAVGSTLEPEEVFKKIIQEIRRAVPNVHCLIAKFNPEEGKYSYYFDDTGEHSGSSTNDVADRTHFSGGLPDEKAASCPGPFGSPVAGDPPRQIGVPQRTVHSDSSGR